MFLKTLELSINIISLHFIIRLNCRPKTVTNQKKISSKLILVKLFIRILGKRDNDKQKSISCLST